MAIPATWSYAWARSGAEGMDVLGKRYDVAYNAPAGTTLATAESALAYGTYYTGQSGIWGSRLRAVGVNPDRRTKQVLVTYHYQPPNVEEALILDTSLVRVESQGEQSTTRPFKDINGDYIWHAERDSTGTPSYKWEPVGGSGLLYERRMLFRTRFARTYGMASNLLYYQDTVNTGIMAQYYNCGAGTLLFAGWAKTRAPTTDKLWIYDCLIQYHPKGWNKETEVQKYEYRAYQVPLRDANGTVLAGANARNETLTDWFPSGATYYAENYAARQWPLILANYDW